MRNVVFLVYIQKRIIGGNYMWRINFQYSDGGKVKVSGKGKVTLEQAERYYKQYGVHSDGGFYQESPYKNYKPEHLTKVISRLQKGGRK